MVLYEGLCARNQKVLFLAYLLNAAARRNVRGTIKKVTEPVEKYPLQRGKVLSLNSTQIPLSSHINRTTNF